MIVVLGAGAAAKISGNPFEGMATITAKIVNQLTGDTEFESPRNLSGLCPWVEPLFHHPWLKRARPAYCAQIPRTI